MNKNNLLWSPTHALGTQHKQDEQKKGILSAADACQVGRVLSLLSSTCRLLSFFACMHASTVGSAPNNPRITSYIFSAVKIGSLAIAVQRTVDAVGVDSPTVKDGGVASMVRA